MTAEQALAQAEQEGLELKRSEGELPEVELFARLEAYHAELGG